MTFLFTDIEGSTRRWEETPEGMRVALRQHDALLRRAIEEQGGFVFKTVGDAFCAAFADAAAALEAALDAQRALRDERSWGEVGALRVRMALHTGEVQEQEGDYFGPPVNRVARILSAGHGGQILLSLATEEELRSRLPGQVELREMGTHRLKDITLPERLYQIVAPDLPHEFPVLKTLDSHPNNLPVQPSALVGREREIAEVRDLLLGGGVRLVTLTGMGGIGKTRLSLGVAAEVLEEFRDGAFFVELAAISDPALVVPSIAQTLGLREERGRPLLQTVQEYLRDKQLLLVLDNFEQVVPAAPQVAALLKAAPGVKAITSSREVLHLSLEREYPVPPLSVPDPERLPPLARLAEYEAVALFVARAQASKPSFELDGANAGAVVRICARLDGLPLALELAAARIKLLPPEAMLKRLDSRLRLLTGGARDLPARQQTLRNAIEWSHDLLSPSERQLFARLAVFVGGRSLEAVEAVCNAEGDLEMDPLEGIASLVDKSLLSQREGPDGEPRFWMLETIREYALERLEEGAEGDALRGRHAAYFLALAEEAEPELTGKRQAEWLQRLEGEHDNLRGALEWTTAAPGGEGATTGLRLAGALWRFWWIHGHVSDGRRWLDRALRAAGEDATPPEARTRALCGAGLLAWYQGDYEAAQRLSERALALAGRVGSRGCVASALNTLGNVARDQGDFAAARERYARSLALYRETGDAWGTAQMLINVAIIACEQGDFSTARAMFQESLALHRESGDKRGVAYALNNLGNLSVYEKDLEGGRALFRESLVLLRELEDYLSVIYCIEGIADVDEELGSHRRAVVLFAATAALREAAAAELPPWERPRYQELLASARRALGEEATAEAETLGRAMEVEDAIAFALHD